MAKFALDDVSKLGFATGQLVAVDTNPQIPRIGSIVWDALYRLLRRPGYLSADKWQR
jgi:hypothetical protein